MFNYIFNQINTFITNLQGKKEFKNLEFGQHLAELRKTKGFSLREVQSRGKANSHKFSYTYVFKLEKGEIGEPAPELVANVLQALGLTDKEISKILKEYGLR